MSHHLSPILHKSRHSSLTSNLLQRKGIYREKWKTCAECQQQEWGLQRRAVNQIETPNGSLTALQGRRSSELAVNLATSILAGSSLRHQPKQVAQPKMPLRVQAKLVVGQPNDKYEQEADRVAEAVMRMPESEMMPFKEDEKTEKEEEEPKELIQPKRRSGQLIEVTPEMETRINSLRGSGQPLPKSLRAFYEPRFGYNFSHVRVHKSSELTQALNAQAFTIGRDIFSAKNLYAPQTPKRKELLAHELAHIIQQKASNSKTSLIQRKQSDSKISTDLGMEKTIYPDGQIAVELIKSWNKRSGKASTYLGMSQVAGILPSILMKELIASGAYKSEKHVQRYFLVGTRILVKEGDIIEISVKGKVYKASGKIKPSFGDFLREGAGILKKAIFGRAPEAPGFYDSRDWRLKPRGMFAIQAKIEPWRAIENLIKNIEKPVPLENPSDQTKWGKGLTRWAFDCFEFTQIVRIYAHWRMMTRTEFNSKFKILELGINAKFRWLFKQVAIEQDRPGKKPYYDLWPRKIFTNKTMEKHLEEAPIGSHITWKNWDAAKRIGIGWSYTNEHSIKVGQNRYVAFGLEKEKIILTEKDIKIRMAQEVLRRQRISKVTNEYIKKNINAFRIRHPRKI